MVDGAGQPIANECVVVDAVWLLATRPSVTTGADGRFAFTDAQVYPFVPPPNSGGANVITHDCSSRIPGFQTTSVHVDLPGPSPDIKIVVTAGAAVFGTLVDAQGLPLSGYCVHVGDAHSTIPSQHAATDLAGHFTVNGIAPGVQPLFAQTSCGGTFIDVEPASIDAVAIETVVVTVPALEDAFASAHVLAPTENQTMHTIGATLAPGETPPSCLPNATRSVWRVVLADEPVAVTLSAMVGSGAVVIYGRDSYGNFGPALSCTTLTSGQSTAVVFGGPQYGYDQDGSAVAFEGWLVEVVSGPSPVVIT